MELQSAGKSTNRYVAIPDSHRVPYRDAEYQAPMDPGETVCVSVYARANPDATRPGDVVAEALVPPRQRRHLDDKEFAANFAASPADLARVAEFARAHGLTVLATHPLARLVQLVGPASTVADAFQVTLAHYSYRDRHGRRCSYRGREGAVHVPAELDGIVTAVVGLDDRPVGAGLLARRASDAPSMAADSDGAPALPAGTFLPTALDRCYDFPADTDGTNQCIAVLAFNGGTEPGVPSGGYRREALETYFEKVLGQPTPDIVDMVAHGPGNEPGSGDPQAQENGDSTDEIMLDLQVVGALAPKAKIVVYFTVFTEQGWLDAMNLIITDRIHRPSVISCSYGNPEDVPGSAWTAMAIRQVDQAFAVAASRGITVCCASGDDGSRDQGSDLRAHADFPASSPFVLGVGGTRLVADDGQILGETAWNDGPGSATGGGISSFFPVPPWQVDAGVPSSANPPHRRGRGVPDVAALADPRTGILVIGVNGERMHVIGGTSAAAPLWAALIARISQALGARVGLLNPILYTKLGGHVLRDITEGDNGVYSAGTGWDPCTGLGSPRGTQLLNGLRA
jgi:kumamolisin